MKALKCLSLVCFLAAAVLHMCSCGQPVVYQQQPAVVVQQPNNQYQIIQDPNSGQQMAVFYDNGMQMMLELAVFNSLMNSGGYGYVVHHYHDYGYRSYNPRTYSAWRNTTSTYRPPSGSYRPNTPATSSGFKNTTTTTRPSGFTSTSRPASTFKSTAPPSRSNTSSFKSTSTPSRPSSSGGGFKRTH